MVLFQVLDRMEKLVILRFKPQHKFYLTHSVQQDPEWLFLQLDPTIIQEWYMLLLMLLPTYKNIQNFTHKPLLQEYVLINVMVAAQLCQPVIHVLIHLEFLLINVTVLQMLQIQDCLLVWLVVQYLIAQHALQIPVNVLPVIPVFIFKTDFVRTVLLLTLFLVMDKNANYVTNI